MRFPVPADALGWPLDPATWLFGGIVLELCFDDRATGPALAEMDVEHELDRLAQGIGQRLLPIVQDNQTILLRSVWDGRHEDERAPARSEIDNIASGVREVLDAAGLELTAVAQYEIGSFESGSPPRLRSDAWLVLLVPERDRRSEFRRVVSEHLRKLEMFQCSSAGRPATVGVDHDAGKWSVRRDTFWAFMDRAIAQTEAADPILQRYVFSEMDSGVIDGVMARKGVLAVALGSGGFDDADRLVRAFASDVYFACMEQIDDIRARNELGLNPEFMGSNMSYAWNHEVLTGLVRGQVWGTIGARVEVFRSWDLVPSGGDIRMETVGGGRVLVRSRH